MKLMPASRALWMIRSHSPTSVLPQSPNIIAPRQCVLTLTPVRPSVRNSIDVPPLWSKGEPSPAGEQARGGEPCGSSHPPGLLEEINAPAVDDEALARPRRRH